MLDIKSYTSTCIYMYTYMYTHMQKFHWAYDRSQSSVGLSGRGVYIPTFLGSLVRKADEMMMNSLNFSDVFF